MWELNTENIVQHIVDICKERNIPVSKLEKDLGYGNGYLNPKKVSDMKTQRLVEILNYLNISPDKFFDTEERIREIENPAIDDDNGFDDVISDKDKQLITWFRSLSPEKQKAILISQDAPEDLL